ncbi:hypothetical protein LINGRAPRIM_LOCUS3009 [Linum grandiflorum]
MSFLTKLPQITVVPTLMAKFSKYFLCNHPGDRAQQEVLQQVAVRHLSTIKAPTHPGDRAQQEVLQQVDVRHLSTIKAPTQPPPRHPGYPAAGSTDFSLSISYAGLAAGSTRMQPCKECNSAKQSYSTNETHRRLNRAQESSKTISIGKGNSAGILQTSFQSRRQTIGDGRVAGDMATLRRIRLEGR